MPWLWAGIVWQSASWPNQMHDGAIHVLLTAALTLWLRPMLEQFLKYCSPWEGLLMKQEKNLGRKEWQRLSVTDWLQPLFLIPCTALGGGGIRVEKMGVKLSLSRRMERREACFSFVFVSQHSFIFNWPQIKLICPMLTMFSVDCNCSIPVLIVTHVLFHFFHLLSPCV